MAPRWSEDDIQYLHDRAGLLSTAKISRHLGRTPHAVNNKMCECGISVFSNFYSARLLAVELGSCKHTVMRWYRMGWLKGRRADWRRSVASMVFLEDDIVAFLKGYPDLLKGHKILNVFFKNIVADAAQESVAKCVK